jgi:hypothetical protein
LLEFVSRKGAKQILKALRNNQMRERIEYASWFKFKSASSFIAGSADGPSDLSAKREQFRASGAVRTGHSLSQDREQGHSRCALSADKDVRAPFNQ